MVRFPWLKLLICCLLFLYLHKTLKGQTRMIFPRHLVFSFGEHPNIQKDPGQKSVPNLLETLAKTPYLSQYSYSTEWVPHYSYNKLIWKHPSQRPATKYEVQGSTALPLWLLIDTIGTIQHVWHFTNNTCYKGPVTTSTSWEQEDCKLYRLILIVGSVSTYDVG